MKMRSALAFCVGVAAALAAPAALADRSFAEITDAEREYRGEFPSARDTVLEIRRQVVEAMRRDGPEGYTAFLVRRRARTGAAAPEEELTVFLSGQYRILGYDAKARTLYVGRVRLVEESFRIVGALALHHPYGPGTAVGPPGAYQFASVSPSGETLVLVDDGVVVVDVATGRFGRSQIEPPLSPNAANPAAGDEARLDGFALGGELMRLQWKDGRSGTLEVRDGKGGPARQIPIDGGRAGDRGP